MSADDLIEAVFVNMCPAEDRKYYSDSEVEGWRKDARAAVEIVLRGLVEAHFGPLDSDEDVDYHYACEGLAQDACDMLRELVERGASEAVQP
jgi:hypothetical protein